MHAQLLQHIGLCVLAAAVFAFAARRLRPSLIHRKLTETQVPASPN